MRNIYKKTFSVMLAVILIIISAIMVSANNDALDQSPNILNISKHSSQTQLEQTLGHSYIEDIDENLGSSNIDEFESIETEELDASEEIINLGASGLLFAAGDSVSVSTFEELKAAINGGATDILIKNDITLKHSLDIPGSIVIDGGNHAVSEGGLYNLNASGNNSTVTIKNMSITGYTHYGFVTTVRAGGTNAVVIYDNISYRGPQLAYMRKSNTLIIKDSKIDITSNGSPSQEVQELAEVTRLELVGDVTIVKHLSPASVYSLVWFIPSSNLKPAFVVRQGANVNIENKKSYFYYIPEASGFDFIVEDGANLVMNMATGWSYSYVHYLDNFIIGEGSNVFMTHTNAKYGYLNNVVNHGGPEGGALTIKNSFRVGQNSVFSLENAHQTPLSPIYLLANNVDFRIEDPKMLYIQGVITGAPANSVNNIYLEAESINVWGRNENHKLGYPILPSGEEGIRSGDMVDGVKNTITLTDFSEEMNFFKKGPYSGIIMGQQKLDLDHNPSENDFTVDGITNSSGDKLILNFIPRGEDGEVDRSAVATADGNFSISLSDEPPQTSGKGPLVRDDLIVLNILTFQDGFAGAPVLHGRNAYMVDGDDPSVKIITVPTIKFGEQKIPTTSTEFPIVEDASIVVEDDTAGTSWSLSLTASPLSKVTPEGTVVIDEDAIGYKKNDVFSSLKEPVNVWISSSDPSNITQELNWAANNSTEGIVLSVSPDGLTTGDYVSELTWTIIITP